MKLIAVVTSQPKSALLAERSFQSITNQTRKCDRIFWFYPTFSVRLNQPYPDVPEWIKNYPEVEVVRCEDYGPSTKVVPLLGMADISMKDTILIFDDDIVFDPRSVERLAVAKGDRDIGVGFRGHGHYYNPLSFSATTLDDTNHGLSWKNRVSVLLCSALFMFPRHMLPTKQEYLDLMDKNPLFKTNDDHIYAHFAYKHNIPLYIVSSEGLSYLHSAREGKLAGSNDTAKAEAVMVCNGQLPVPWAFIVFIMVILFLLAGLVYYFAKMQNGLNRSYHQINSSTTNIR